MQPGLSRAIPLSVLGFVLGALIVLILRGLQAMDPVWDPGVGLVLATFMCAGFFVWGMGAFDPRMSAHGEEAEHAAAPEPETPSQIVGGLTWQVTALLIVSIIVVFALAAYSGLNLVTTEQPLASTTAIGMNPVLVADLAHLFILLLTPLVLLGALALVLYLVRLLLRQPPAGVVRSRRSWALRALTALGLFVGGTLLVPLWFDTVSPLRGPPQTLILLTVPEPYSVSVTRWINDGLVRLFGGATQIYVSQLVFFIGFIAALIVSLLVFAGGLGLVFFALTRGLATSRAEAELRAKAIAAREKAAAAGALGAGGSPVAALPGGTTSADPLLEIEIDERPAFWRVAIATPARGLARLLRKLPGVLQ